MNEYTVYMDIALDLSADGPDEAEEKARSLLRDIGIDIVEGSTEVVEWRE